MDYGPQLSALAREIAELNAVLRGQAERDAPVRRGLYESRFMGRERSLAYIEVSLTSARSVTGVGSAGPEEFNFPGSVLFADQLTTGDAFIHFDSKDAPGFPFSASTGLLLPYRKFFITNAAQAGLVLRLWYGFDASIIPPNQDVANIGTVGAVTSITNALTPRAPGSSRYTRFSAVNSVQTIVAPASNTGGIDVEVVHMVGNSSTVSISLMAKSSAPANVDDATARILARSLLGSNQVIQRSFRVPAGLGLYEAADNVGVTSYIDMGYTVL